MLQKSKKSAFILAGIASLSYAITELLNSLAIRWASFGSIPSLQEELATEPELWALAVIVLLIFTIAVIGGGFLINKLPPDHFGLPGAFRWGLSGVLYAVLSILYRLYADSIPMVLKGLGELAVLILSYVIAFKVIPTSRKINPAI